MTDQKFNHFMDNHDPRPMTEQQRTTDGTAAKDTSTRWSGTTHFHYTGSARQKAPQAQEKPSPVEKTRIHSKNNPVTLKMWHAACTMGEVAGLEGPPIHARNHAHTHFLLSLYFRAGEQKEETLFLCVDVTEWKPLCKLNKNVVCHERHWVYQSCDFMGSFMQRAIKQSVLCL